MDVPLTNLSYDPVTVVVTALYDDLTEVHEAQTVVSLAPKQTATVTVTFSITDHINPQLQITEGPDPIPMGIALATSLGSN